ncbi:MAG: lysylphosphatidylglycerol synthase transmembrane domain-containing protein [Desulfonatronovibrio sp.]
MRKVFFQICLSVLLLGYFALRVNWGELAAAFIGINAGFYLLSTLATLMALVLVSFKYRLLIAHTSLDLPFSRLVAINFITKFYALFLPSALGPEAVRWYKITRNKKGKAFFLASTIVERLLFILVLFACGSIPLFFTGHPDVKDLADRLWPVLAAASAGLLCVLAYFLWPAFQQKARTFLMKTLDLSEDSRLKAFLDNFSLKNSTPEIFGKLLFYSLVWQLFFLIRIYFLFESLDLPFTFQDATWMGSLVMLLQVLPVTFSGLGIREGAYAFLFSLQGVSAEAGVVVGLLFFSQMLVLSLIGWALQLIEKPSDIK